MTSFAREEEVYPEQVEGKVFPVDTTFDTMEQYVWAMSLDGGRRVVPPEIHDVVHDLPKHNVLRYDQRDLSTITHLCIHHSAGPASIPIIQVANYHIRQDKSRGKDAWPGIGYHFYIKPDGTIFQTNYLQTVSYHVYQNNAYSVGICLAGDYTDSVPPEPQIFAAAWLAAWLVQEHGLKVENILGHREFPHNTTECPGRQWIGGRVWKQILLDAVRFMLADDGPAVPAAPVVAVDCADVLREINAYLRLAWNDMRAHGYAYAEKSWPPMAFESQNSTAAYHIAKAAQICEKGS